MTTRTTKADLQQYVNVINRLTDNRCDFSISRAYGKPRLYRSAESVEVSPRLPAGQLADWMHAYINGINFARAIDATRPAVVENDFNQLLSVISTSRA